jgi:PDZ domain
MRLSINSTLQLVACLAIAAAGLVPVVHKNMPFWGLATVSFGHSVPIVQVVEADSPANSAGLQELDEIATVNGSVVDNSGFYAVLRGLKTGDKARLHVRRSDEEIDLSVEGIEPPIAMIYYSTVWHPVAGGVALALGILLLATQSRRPVPRSRVGLVIAVGLGLAVLFLLFITFDNPSSFWQLQRYHSLNWGTKLHFGQNWVGLAASLLLAGLGAWQLRGLPRKSGAATGFPTSVPNVSVESLDAGEHS